MIFAQIWMNSIGEDVATKKRVYLYSQYINKHIIIHTYIQYMYVYIRDDVTQNLQLIIPGMHWLTKKNDQGTAGCRPDSPAIPSSSASCTSNCYRHVLSDMVDVGWVFLKMTPMLDVSLSLSEHVVWQKRVTENHASQQGHVWKLNDVCIRVQPLPKNTSL